MKWFMTRFNTLVRFLGFSGFPSALVSPRFLAAFVEEDGSAGGVHGC